MVMGVRKVRKSAFDKSLNIAKNMLFVYSKLICCLWLASRVKNESRKKVNQATQNNTFFAKSMNIDVSQHGLMLFNYVYA